ncbi:GNAT family N-acetyltransferase [Streptococcus catagoni]|uniref:GNAT family N-acetyltransferase n=1 Tax=Streptococcus catagoni TaxID=2654874 RepID=UPI001408BE32|nr:GNAT family N-acetyltransferase [Streptococcus catagoni]
MDFWTQLARYSFYELEDYTLRPLNYGDAADFYHISADKDHLEFIFPRTPSKEESDYLFVHAFLKNPLGSWAICDKKIGKMIGVIRFEKIQLSQFSAEIAYFLKYEFRNKGLMTEVVKNIVFLAFTEFDLKELNIITHLENKASQRVAKKAGFQLKKQFKGSDRYSHKMRDYLLYQLKVGKNHE